MPKSYTSNQTGAIACALTNNMWGLTVHGVGWMFNQTHVVYSILIIIGWILLPFYIKLNRHAFITGMFFWILAMCYLVITPSLLGTTLWYAFTNPLYHFSFVVWYLIAILGTYFSYKSWKELHIKEVIKI